MILHFHSGEEVLLGVIPLWAVHRATLRSNRNPLPISQSTLLSNYVPQVVPTALQASVRTVSTGLTSDLPPKSASNVPLTVSLVAKAAPPRAQVAWMEPTRPTRVAAQLVTVRV